MPLAVADALDSELAATAQRIVRTAAERFATSDIAGPGWLKSRLKNPHKLVEKCGADLACLGRLVKRAGVNELLVSRAVVTAGGGVQVTLQRVSAGGRLLGSGTATARGAAELESALWQQLNAALGRGVPRAVAELDLPLAALDDRDAGDDDEEEEEELEPLQPLTALEPLEPLEPLTRPPASGDTDESESDDLDLVALAPRPPPATEDSRFGTYLAYGGVAGAGAGVVLFGIGAVYGVRARGLEDVRAGSDQAEVFAQQEEQNSAAGRGSAFMVSGALLAAAGITSLALDVIFFGGSLWPLGEQERAP